MYYFFKKKKTVEDTKIIKYLPIYPLSLSNGKSQKLYTGP